MKKQSFIKAYGYSLVLIIAIIIGSLLGLAAKENAVVLKPFGDIFLNLLFTVVVPLVFFSIASTVANVKDIRRLGKITGVMVIVFIVTGIFASMVMLVGVLWYPPSLGSHIPMPQPVKSEHIDIAQQLVRTLTVPDFKELFSKSNMLALIIFSFMVGLATSAVGVRGRMIGRFLSAGNEVMTKVIGYVMLYAPIGLGAYFAYLVGTFGPQLFGTYLRAVTLYYPLALIYCVVAFTFYTWLAGGLKGIKLFWGNILPPALTAWGTGSGLATLPINLDAAKRIGMPEDVREMVVNIGASVHSDGSCLAAVMKIALLFGIYNMPFEGVSTFAAVIGVALLCGTVISGIPSGGMLGEILIITMFGFPIEAMPIITMLGTLVDPPATMVNVIGDNVCGMLVARVVNGRNWMKAQS